MEQRAYGKTGEILPILSFGAQRIVDERGCSEAEAIKMVNYAIDHGIKYFDTAWVYSDGQSEERLGKVVKTRRKEMWTATKTVARDESGARRQLEESLKRLQTDHVDEWRMHNVWSMRELGRITAPGGVLKAAIKAREQGLIRFISISGHSNPSVQIEALNRFQFDSVLCATSVFDHFILSFAEELLPEAKAKGVAVAGMKILALGGLAAIYERALRYALSLPIDTAVVGMESMAQLRRNLAVAEAFKPLGDEERLELFKEVLPMLSPENAPWKAENWENPIEWKRRK